MVDGKWPWESGEVEVADPVPAPAIRDDLYVLPRIKDVRSPEADANGMRPMTIQEMRARNAPVKEESVHDW